MCSETGEQLLARLAAKPDLTGLERTLFPDGPTMQSVTEVCGEEGCGKTQFLLHLLANAVLPHSWCGVDIGGLETGVLWIDTECQLSLVRLMGLLEAKVRQCQQPGTTMTEEDVDGLIQNSLKRVHVTQCHSSANLLLTLYSLETLLSMHSNIGLLLIDSMSAFYWIDRCNVADSYVLREAFFKQITTAIEHLIHTYRLVAFATTTALFQKRVKERRLDEGFAASHGVRENHEYSDYLGRSWQRLVTHRMVFSQDPDRQRAVFSVAVKLQGSVTSLVKRFTLGESGIQFL